MEIAEFSFDHILTKIVQKDALSISSQSVGSCQQWGPKALAPAQRKSALDVTEMLF